MSGHTKTHLCLILPPVSDPGPGQSPAAPHHVLQGRVGMHLKGLGTAALLGRLEPHVLANAASY